MESPYQKHFDTNYVPTVDEARQIRMIVDESNREIADMNAQVDTLQKQLNLLQDKRDEIQISSDKHQALLSLMRQLTRDVLGEIFLACLPTNRNPCMSASEAPMLLTRICSSWRQIALSTPVLWAKIHVALPVFQAEQCAGDQDLIMKKVELVEILKLRETAVNEWINCSSACPLSISIYQSCAWIQPMETESLYPVYNELQSLHVSFMRNTIIPHHKRWRDFDIYAADEALCGLIDVGLKAESLQMLETFHVTRQFTYNPGSHALRYHWKDIVSLMPSSITSATLYSFPIRNSDMHTIYSHPWGRVTELCLKLDNIQTTSPPNALQLAASILRHCHCLKTLKLIVFSTQSNDIYELQHREDIVLQYLTTLSISLPLGPAGLAFTKLLCLPLINELGIDFNAMMVQGADNRQLGQDIIKSLLRATDDYRVLSIATPFWGWSADFLVQLLKAIPAVRVLYISARNIDVDRWSSSHSIYPQPLLRNVVNDSLLQALMPTNKSDSDIICPKLEVLIFDHRETGITETCLKEFLMARKSDERVPALRRISVYIDQPKQKEGLNMNKVSLGRDSAVYFQRQQYNPYSPFDGYKDDFVSSNVLSVGSTLTWDCYNEL